MSFKREGDDWSQLNVLKKRRVGDLLASYIPEDEALMLRDGRFACAVCPHRPVLDTLTMLTAHRAGKRHLASLQDFYGKKHQWKGEQNPKQQEERRTEKIGDQAPLLAQTRLITQSALRRAPNYNSCCRRQRNRPEAPSSSAPHLSHRPPQTETPSDKKADRTPKSEGDMQAKRDSVAAPAPVSLSPARRRALDHYLNLRSSGWIQDGRGQWVKDKNVEFDSDEEEPPDFPLD
ncbi:sodium channel modifier 1 isoform X1 [Notamacropus eugenii]|uniref:sodium channel modifier 1 isoform X1 n=1 Tax=Notamacropus eugenii TaxID=9315 RepID=UPI003B6709D0